jgi:D-xylose transport system substrate-binding protein
VNFISVASYSAVGEEGVKYVLEHDTSITKKMVCEGPAAETKFCKN